MTQLRAWANRLPYLMRPGPALGFDLVRAYLGIGLFVRGVLFVSRPELVLGYLSSGESWFVPYAIAHYVALAHLGGGLLLAFGLATRLAAFVQMRDFDLEDQQRDRDGEHAIAEGFDALRTQLLLRLFSLLHHPY